MDRTENETKFFKETGFIMEQFFYDDGTLRRTVYADGSAINYRHGRVYERVYIDNSLERYNMDGSLSERVHPDSTCDYYNRGHLAMRQKPDGTRESYYQSGALYCVFALDGSGIHYYESGSIKAICHQHLGRQEFDDVNSIQARCRQIKEELVAAVFHPRRVERWLEAGVLDMMFGA